MTAPELNPIAMEHRVTVLEQAQLRMVENVGNLALSVDKFQSTCAKNEERRIAEQVRLRDELDTITTGISERNKMDASYKEGRESVKVRLPYSQVAALVVGSAAIVTALTKIVSLF